MAREGPASDGWDPAQYEKFAAERSRPFFDLLDLVRPVGGGDVVDLGCGTGELTLLLHERSGAARTLGIDNSDAMLERARMLARPGVSFELADISAHDVSGRFDLVFSNAALQWMPNHEQVVTGLAEGLRSGGQLAVQVPANADHPSHTLAAEVAMESPFRDAMGGSPPADVVLGVLRPERYAEMLDRAGFSEQHVRLQVYGHHLPSTAAVAEWTRGTSLVRFRRLLPEELFERFVERYRRRLLDVLGDRSPFFYPFKRILLWGCK